MTITFDGAGASAPSRSVAISMVSSLPSIGARPTYSDPHAGDDRSYNGAEVFLHFFFTASQ